MRRIISTLYLSTTVFFSGAVASAEEIVPINLESHVLGVVQYRGGFAKDLGVQLAVPTTLRGFTVVIPGFCRDVEVLDAGAKGNLDSILVRRSTTEPNTFLIERGVRVEPVISSLTVTLNGPLTAGCDVPVLELEGDAPVPPTPIPQEPTDGYFGSADGTRVTIEGSRVVRHNLALSTPGSNLSSVVVLTSPLMSNGPNSVNYQAYGYADYPVRHQFGMSYCRAQIYFAFDYRNISRDELIMRMNYPSSVFVDQFGRCAFGNQYTGTWYLRQLSE